MNRSRPAETSVNTNTLVAYGLLLFVLGCRAGALIPSFPVWRHQFCLASSDITFLIAIMGFALVLSYYPAAWLSGKYGSRVTLRLAAALLVVGLFVRARIHIYTPFLLGQILGVLTTTLCYGPVGSIICSCGAVTLRDVTSIIIGGMPFGSGAFALVGHGLALAMGQVPSFLTLSAAGLVAGIYLWVAAESLPARRAPGDRLSHPRRYIRLLTAINIGIAAVTAALCSGFIPFAAALDAAFAAMCGGFGFAIFLLLNAEGACQTERLGQAGVITSTISMGNTSEERCCNRFLTRFVVANDMAWVAISTLLNALGAVFSFRTGRSEAPAVASEAEIG